MAMSGAAGEDPADPADPVDPVKARRDRIGRLAAVGQQVGYACLGLAVVVFAVGAATSFGSLVVVTVVVLLAAGSAVLLPAIVVGFGVRAADRDERRGRTSGH
jgi:hypothetical protein